MKIRAAFSPHYSIDLGPHHPFPMGKYVAVHDRLAAEGTLAPEHIANPGPARLRDLLRVHCADYVCRFLEGGLSSEEERRLGFRWSPELARRASYATAGTLLAAHWA